MRLDRGCPLFDAWMEKPGSHYTLETFTYSLNGARWIPDVRSLVAPPLRQTSPFFYGSCVVKEIPQNADYFLSSFIEGRMFY